MMISLSLEQEQRVQAVIRNGSYDSVDEVMEAALAAVEQRTVPGFEGTEEQLETLLLEGLASTELSEDEFWDSVNKEAGALLADHRASRGL